MAYDHEHSLDVRPAAAQQHSGLRPRPTRGQSRRTTTIQSNSTVVSLDNRRVQYDMPDRSQSTLAAPSNPIEIGFEDLHYVVPIDDGKSFKKVLKGVSGTFAPGNLVAIMGASGAGKTSMLNAISGELQHGQLYGEITLNGVPETCKTVRQISGFVFQDDVILPTMTVLESLQMSATLRLPKDMSANVVQSKIDGLIQVLGLEKCRDTIIGSSLVKGVSGGERKRCSIAMELITDPPILFLDEPTSGLDTYTAYATMSLLSNLAASGRTIVSTIHQPSSEIFQLFSDLLILADGQVMYFGPAENAVEYFSHLGYPTPKFSNPADYFFMSILNKTLRGKGETLAPEERIDYLIGEWRKSAESRAVHARHVQVRADSHPDEIDKGAFGIQASMWKQFMTVFKRSARDQWRNTLILNARFGQALFLAVFLGLCYLRLPNRRPDLQIQDFGGAIFFVPVNMLMSNATSTLNVFAEEKAVFQREFTNGYYKLFPYFMAKVIADMPIIILAPVLFTVIFYFMVGFRTDEAGPFFIFLLVSVLSSAAGQSFGMFAASLFGSVEMGLVLVPMILIPLMLFGGLLTNGATIPVYFNWIKWISPVKYSFSALVQTEFQDRDICESDNPDTECVPGQSVIESFNLDNEGSVWFSIGMLIVWWFVVTLLAYLGLYRIVVSAKRIEVKSGDKMPKDVKEENYDAGYKKAKDNGGLMAKFRKN